MEDLYAYYSKRYYFTILDGGTAVSLDYSNIFINYNDSSQRRRPFFVATVSTDDEDLECSPC
jgi:hypothetical protein